MFASAIFQQFIALNEDLRTVEWRRKGDKRGRERIEAAELSTYACIMHPPGPITAFERVVMCTTAVWLAQSVSHCWE